MRWLLFVLAVFCSCKNPPDVFLTEGGPDAPSTEVKTLPALGGTGKTSSSTQRGGTQDVAGFDSLGKIPTLSGAVYIRVMDSTSVDKPGSLEIAVGSGHVRGYLAIGNHAFVHMSKDQGGYRYVDATPGHPAKLGGELVYNGGYGCVLEAVDGDAHDVQYHMWR